MPRPVTGAAGPPDQRQPIAVEVDQLTTAELFELYSVKKLADTLAELDNPEPEWPQLDGLDRPEMAEAMRDVVDRLTVLPPPPPVTPEVRDRIRRILAPMGLPPVVPVPTLPAITLPELSSVGTWLRTNMVAAGRSPAAAIAGLLDLADEAGLDPAAAAGALTAGLGGA